MKIDKTTIKHGVWYEDINGNRIPCEENECSTPELDWQVIKRFL